MITHKTSNKRMLKQIFKYFTLPTPPRYNQEGHQESSHDLTVSTFDFRGAAGYWSSHSETGTGIVLKKGSEVVMSCTPMEIESHIVAQHSAKGRVVIAGLGLAMITCSLLKKKAVTHLTVLELDQNIISMYPDLLAGEDKQLWLDSIDSGRLRIEQVDCKAPLDTQLLDRIGRVDYLWADIWNNLGNSEAANITRNLCKQLKPKLADYWGWEIELVRACIVHNIDAGKDNPYVMPSRFLKDHSSSLDIPLTIYQLDTERQKTLGVMAFAATKNTLTQEKALRDRQATIF
ncbi:hypothetical protein L1D14_03805 [Vibrio tubiashii]|uniref:hypothetical protein n=1 Tax=Vibrio tubiashii TaxID=29498 RepID=UPI001EFEA5E4|nr:hypothetical protein [Vibrio tubiashii]MCG9575355.1 hypothetical protein [Vibrio tubiashii]